MSNPSGATGADVPSLLEAIAATGASLSQREPGAREKLLDLTHALTSALETPSETIQRIGWAEPARFAAAQAAVDLGLFEELAGNGDATMTASQLASSKSADVSLVARILKHLSAMKFISERGADEYAATSLSNALTTPKFRDGINYLFHVAGPSFHGMPAYFKKTGYRNPTDISDGPFQYGHKTDAPFWAWLGERPSHLGWFNNYMSGYRQGRPSWMDPGFYPVNDRLIHQSLKAEGAVLIVDVGGGIGHDLEEFKLKHPEAPGRLILQERQEVIDQISQALPGIELRVHDFFTPQPVKGAKAYYLHSVLHDWDDKTCRQILGQLVPAMERNYSKILINELVVPDVGATWPVTSMDWLMMALGAVRERTAKQWQELLSSAGLRLVKIWTYEPGTESLIEAELDT
ncbi:hypothetical protein MMC08_006296 [Hypocenomyce scalaris]|nr:hypothetical protein [Hypocenomyce scalaris]